MKESFCKPCAHTLKEYILYLVICQLLFRVQQLCIFFSIQRVGSWNNMLYEISQYIPKPFYRYRRNLKVELGLSYYAKYAALIEGTGAHTINLSAKSDLDSSKVLFS